MNRQSKQRTIPGVPSTYAFAIPNNATDGGVKHIAPTKAARRRSSATHFPARFLRHFSIMKSERRPASGAPTFHASNKKEADGVSRCQNAGVKREGVRARLTHVADTSGYKTRPYQRLVVNIVSLSLEYVVANWFHGSKDHKHLLIEVETTHKSGRHREEQDYN